MFQKDINRDINGVVKVAQDDEKSLHQELSEYIITKELRRHFRTFFDNYTKAIDQPTDKMGVWISGFCIPEDELCVYGFKGRSYCVEL